MPPSWHCRDRPLWRLLAVSGARALNWCKLNNDDDDDDDDDGVRMLRIGMTTD